MDPQGHPKTSQSVPERLPGRPSETSRTSRGSPSTPQEFQDAPRHPQRDQRTTLQSLGEWFKSVQNRSLSMHWELQRHRWMF